MPLISDLARSVPWTFFAVVKPVGKGVAVTGDDIGRQGMSVVSIWAKKLSQSRRDVYLSKNSYY